MKTLGELVERNARFFADDVCLVHGERRFTNREHLERARKLAAALHDAGCRRQDRVAILAMNTFEYLEVFSACWLAGYIVATVNFRRAAPEPGYRLGDTAPRVLIFEAQYAEAVASLRGELPQIETFVCIGPAPDWAVDY